MAQQRFMRDGQWMTEDGLKRYNAKEIENEETVETEKPLTKNQIMDELKALNVEFKTSAKRDELEILLNESKAKIVEPSTDSAPTENGETDANIQ